MSKQDEYVKQLSERRSQSQSKLGTEESIVPTVTPTGVKDTTTNKEVITEVNPEDYKVEVQDFEKPTSIADQRAAISTKVDINKLRATLSPQAGTILELILKYMQDMDPKYSVDPKKAGYYQKSLGQALIALFNNTPEKDFPILYPAVLDLFEEHKDGVFNDEKVYRYPEYWIFSEDESKAFRRMLNLLLTTRDAKTRKQSLKQIRNWEYVLQYGYTELGRNRVRAFYGL